MVLRDQGGMQMLRPKLRFVRMRAWPILGAISISSCDAGARLFQEVPAQSVDAGAAVPPGAVSSGDAGTAAGPVSGFQLAIDPAQNASLCGRKNGDAIAVALCSKPSISGLVDLLEEIGLGPGARLFAAVASSSSLVGRKTSPLNPRVIVYPLPTSAQGPFKALGFARGEPIVEMVAYDPGVEELNFYLLRFGLECESKPDGCALGDLYTTDVERNWPSWTVYQDRDLAGTALDCLTCHQPGGPGTRKLLRMQEIDQPWLHWFPAGAAVTDERTGDIGVSESERVLGGIFLEAHANDPQYAGLSLKEMRAQIGIEGAPGAAAVSALEGAAALENFIDDYWVTRLGLVDALEGQDFKFDSETILKERDVGSRDTWLSYADEMHRGRRPLVAYYDVDASDPMKRQSAEASYLAATQSGSSSTLDLDPSDILSADAESAVGFVPTESESAEELLHHFCERCHNDRLDQTVSRAKFNVLHLDALSVAEKALAVTRINESADSRWIMPPRRTASLPPWAIERIAAYLAP
jgi:hypothetical protein